MKVVFKENKYRLILEHWLELHKSTYMHIFSNKYSTCIFILQILKLTKCGEKFVFEDLSPDSIQTVSASCPWVSHLSIPLFFRQR